MPGINVVYKYYRQYPDIITTNNIGIYDERQPFGILVLLIVTSVDIIDKVKGWETKPNVRGKSDECKFKSCDVVYNINFHQ